MATMKMTRSRKILSLILCLIMILGFMPNFVGAAENHIVYVGGLEMSASDDGVGCSYYFNGSDETPAYVTDTEGENWNAKLWYDNENSKLILEINGLDASGDLNYSKAEQGSSENTADLKRCAGIYSDDSLYIIVRGENKVHGVEYDKTYNWNDSTNKVNSKKSSDSLCYGIYISQSLSITSENGGKLTVTTDDVDGSCYGIYSNGILNVLSGELNVTAGSSVDILRLTSHVSYGIYANEVVFGSNVDAPTVFIKSGTSYSEACGIYSKGNLTIKNGNITSRANRAKSYSDAVLVNGAKVSVLGGKLDASSIGADSSMSTGITANEFEVISGEVIAKGGDNSDNGGASAGIYVNYDINITGGSVSAEGGKIFGDISFGINSWRGNIIIDNAVVNAKGGPASYSVGLCAEKGYSNKQPAGGDLTIRNGAKVYVSTNNDDLTRLYSYAVYVGNDLLIEDNNTYVEAVAGRVNNTDVSPASREKRSFGVYLGEYNIADNPDLSDYGTDFNAEKTNKFTITGGTLIAKTLDNDNGEITDDDNQVLQQKHRSYAAVILDAQRIDFSDESQTNDKWYQWRSSESDSFTLSTSSEYADKEEKYSSTGYLQIEPIPVYKKVTFKIVNGTWADGTTDDIIVNVPLVSESGVPDKNGFGTLKIPSGMIANDNFGNGSWDNEPTSSVSGTEDLIYTYKFTEKTYDSIYKKVTFKIVNGTWADGTTDDIIVNVPLVSESGVPDKNGFGTLKIPSGMIANDNFGNGSWDNEPTSSVSGTANLTYTYTFTEITSGSEIPTPKTGDNSRIILWVVLFIVFGVVLIFVGKKYMCKNK